ncbi:phosphoribosylamine--glycine ligase [Marinitoga hydrogenitolerans DSM 16785]|uniref:Phosphoribosylamine--glycine ligase n=1 Tax=Marinitoga hydrogenitolerans (strain DSM 16785 / JCM 12826 / AT1271) TaxID=1122195 RepID=A0A1M4YVT4_MARH1|nr:phosphoribosylamine--glycine ligase [Marinitoga hydrogenitolerans]SHF09456.1 phosphoribosylamine--glycine ligase [Marinitoga hydrogenitolerans DSM 16785]
MKVAVIGNGGREHAIAWKLSQSKRVKKIYCIPGNGGTALENKCENIDMKNIDEIINFVRKNNIELTIVGPEKYLVEGIVDEFKKEGLNIIGPNKKVSMLEGSKIYAKNFAKKYGVQTAKYKDFKDYNIAVDYIKTVRFPIVIKADGLAGGKGVIISKNFSEAKKTLNDFMNNDVFLGAGKNVLIEEYLEGYEMSIFILLDGENYKIFQTAKDHKKILEGEKGLNTGGMGAISPHPKLSMELMDKIKEKIIEPTISGIKEEKLNYNGILFIGLMIQENEPYLLEYNVRFGDPETQAMLPLLETDLLEIFNHIIEKKLDKINIKWKDNISCCVVLAAKGYPIKYEKGNEIKTNIDSYVFHAGTILKDGKLLTNGGRVLSIVDFGRNIKEARKRVYNKIKRIEFKDKYYRKDIGIM